MITDSDVAERSIWRRCQGSNSQAIPRGNIDELFNSHQGEEWPPTLVLLPAALARATVVIFTTELKAPPTAQEEVHASFGQVSGRGVEAVSLETLVDQVVRWRPDSATPILLVFEGFIVAGNCWQYVLAPEFLLVEKGGQHSLSTVVRRDAGHQRVEVRCRDPSGQSAIPETVNVHSAIFVPEEVVDLA